MDIKGLSISNMNLDINRFTFCIVFEHKQGILSYITFTDSNDQKIFSIYINYLNIGISRIPKPQTSSYVSSYQNKKLMFWFSLYNDLFILHLNVDGANIRANFNAITQPIKKIKFNNWVFKTNSFAMKTDQFYDQNDIEHHQILLNVYCIINIYEN